MSCQCNTISQAKAENPAGKKRRGKGLNLVTGSLLLLMPKCAMCWAAYLSFFGCVGLPAVAYRPWFLPVAVLLFCFTMGRLLWRAIAVRNYLVVALAVTAALLIAWQKWTMQLNALTVVAFLLMTIAWLIDGKPGLITQAPTWRINFSSKAGSGNNR